MDPALFQALRWRCIGPPRAGAWSRSPATRPSPWSSTSAPCAGGVWKTTDGGTYWQNVSDGFFTHAVRRRAGGRRVRPQRHLRRDRARRPSASTSSYGDGVYKSTDAGQTWAHVGLADTRHIGKIRVHPRDPDLVYVAALGHAFGPNEERGVYRSRDGGRTWQQVLFRSDKAGAVDLALDPTNPRILYAAIWEVLSPLLDDLQRRAGQRALQVHRRRRHLDGHHRQPGAAARHQGQDRRRGLAGARRPRLGHRRGGGRRPLPLRRRRPDLGAGLRQPRPDPPRPGTTATSSPTRSIPTRSTSTTSRSGSRPTAGAPSPRSPRPTATTTTSGSTRATPGA